VCGCVGGGGCAGLRGDRWWWICVGGGVGVWADITHPL